jgi:biotin transport system substrate-specific component
MLTNYIAKQASTSRVLAGFVFMFACSQIYIPTSPVPITMQTVAAILLGLVYPCRDNIKVFAIYFIAGSLGAPVYFSFTSGIAKLYGPTAGYLIGMAMAAILLSYLREKFSISLKKNINILGLVFFGHVIIYTMGLSWLTYLTSFREAFYSGFLTLIPTGMIKVLALSIIFRLIDGKNS